MHLTKSNTRQEALADKTASAGGAIVKEITSNEIACGRHGKDYLVEQVQKRNKQQLN